MKKIAIIVAAATALCSLVTDAQARPGVRPGHGAHYGHGRVYSGRHRGNAGAAVAAGIAGALIGGAAIAATSRHRDYYVALPAAYGYPAYGPAPAYYDDGY
jgi:hypothetical protein